MTLANLKRMLAVAVLSSIATGVFAEEGAPVYDVDNYPPQFDGTQEADNSPLPPPPSSSSQPDLQPQIQSPHQDAAPPAAVHSSAVAESTPPPPPSPPLTMDQRMRRVEQQMSNTQQATTPKVEALQNQVQALRGQVEELTHQLQQLQAQQRGAMLSSTDKPSTKQPVNETTVASADTSTVAPADNKPAAKTDADTQAAAKKPGAFVKSPSVSSSAVPLQKSASAGDQPNAAEEQQIYQTAYDLIKAKKYNEAVATLQKMLQKYPTGQSAANAHYWLGELYGLLNKNDLSALEFTTVVNNYPDSPKVADAQLKVGLIYAGQFKWVDAKGAFKKVVNRYPGTSSAHVASEQLKQIKLAGH